MKKISAFTLIETIIAISVFCIGILAVLIGVSKTLRNQDYANIQIKSAFFAREGIEMIFNIRDANYHKELPWNCIFAPVEPGSLKQPLDEDENPFCKGFFEPGMVLKVEIGDNDNYIHIETGDLDEDFDTNFQNFVIYFHTGDSENTFVYNHTGTDDETTFFARYLTITGVVDENSNLISTGDLLKIESHVLYKKGELTGEKVMETFMGNYEF